jgi:[ribosomal protein S5]-alanine N-acetyltransferase
MNTNLLFGNFPVLETQRLILKPIEIDDCHLLLSINNDPDVVQKINYGKTFDLNDTYETITNYYHRLFNERKGIVWGMYLKPNNNLIGLRMCFVDSFDEPVTIQGQILKLYRQMGLTLEAYIEIIKFLRKAEVEKIKANCDKDNIPAIGLLKKLGFEKPIDFGFSMFSPNAKALIFNKDLTRENTKLFSYEETQQPKIFEEACELAMKMYLKKEFVFAEEYINMAINFQPHNPRAYLLKGKISKAFKGNTFAISDFREAIKIDEYLAEAYRELGICQYNLAMRLDAHKNWEKAVSLGDEKAKELIEKYPS